MLFYINIYLNVCFENSFSAWLIYNYLISIFIILLFIIIIAILLPNKARQVKFLNIISSYYLFLFGNLISLDFDYLQIEEFQNFLLHQNISLFVNFFIFLATLTVFFFFLSISNIFFIYENSKMEFSLLIWFIYFSAICLISTTDFISIIILLECIAFSSYVLVGFERKNKFSTISGLKYLILASIPSGLFILGIGFLYQLFGTFSQINIQLILNSAFSQDFFNIKNFTEKKLDFFFLNLWYEIKNHYIYQYIEIFNNKNFFYYFYLGFEYHFDNYFKSINNYLLYYSPLTPLYIQTFENILINFSEFELDLNSNNKKISYWILEQIYFDNVYGFFKGIRELYVLYNFYNTHFYQTFTNVFDFSAHETLTIFSNLNYNGILDWFALFHLAEYLRFSTILSYFGIGDVVNQAFSILNFKPFLEMNFMNIILLHLEMQDCANKKLYFINDVRLENVEIFNQYFIISDFLEKELVKNKSFFLEVFKEHILFQNALIKNFQVENFWLQNLMQFLQEKIQWENFFKNTTFYVIAPYFPEFSIYLFFEMLFEIQEISFNEYLLYLSLFFILLNLFFKLTAAPFHFWAPSVYGGAPLATLTFLSIFSKLTIIFILIWLFFNIFLPLTVNLQLIFFFIAFLSIIFSILGAFSEKSFKRFYIYSSTGHVGFMLLGFAVLNFEGIRATVDYLILYIISSLIIWFIIMHLTNKTITLINLKGLSFNQPYLSLIFSIIIFSLSGIPPFGGFFVKYEIFFSLIESSFFFFSYFLLILTVISFFYYLRLIKIIFFENSVKIIKNKNLADMKLRLISYLFFLIPFYFFFFENSLLLWIKEILLSSLY